MSQRPRVVVLSPSRRDDATDATRLPDLAKAVGDAVELVAVTSADEAIEALRTGAAAAIATDAPTAAEVVDALASGLVVIAADQTIVWHNPAFGDFLGGGSRVGQKLYAALSCDATEGPDFSPVGDCLAGRPLTRSKLRLKTGKHVELSCQPLARREGSILYLLCNLRDITFEVQEREKLIAIHRAGLELSHLTPEELAQMSTAERIDLLKANILQYSQKVLNFKNLEVRLLDPETKRLTILLSEGMTADAHERALFASLEGNGVTGFVAATGLSYLCSDVSTDPHYLTGALDARSSLTVPMIYRERVIGVFNVESPVPNHFTESDREFLEIFAREIAVALHTLDLLQAENRYGGSQSVEQILTEVSLPVDEIVADTIRMFDYLHAPLENKEAAHEAIRRVLLNARAIKTSIGKVGRRFEPRPLSLSPAESSLLAGRRILLVDADPQIRRSGHYLFNRVGCDVDTARDGAEAIRLVHSIRYDVIMGDIRLPDMNGYQFFTRMREEAPGTPVVLMTGFGYDANHCMVRARQEGLRVVLYKPFRLDRLCEATEDALDPHLASEARARAAKLQAKQSIL